MVIALILHRHKVCNNIVSVPPALRLPQVTNFFSFKMVLIFPYEQSFYKYQLFNCSLLIQIDQLPLCAQSVTVRAALRRKTWGGVCWLEDQHDPAMSTGSLESQTCPGQCGQQDEGGDSALCSCECSGFSSGVHLGFCIQLWDSRKMWTCWIKSRGGH